MDLLCSSLYFSLYKHDREVSSRFGTRTQIVNINTSAKVFLWRLSLRRAVLVVHIILSSRSTTFRMRLLVCCFDSWYFFCLVSSFRLLLVLRFEKYVLVSQRCGSRGRHYHFYFDLVGERHFALCPFGHFVSLRAMRR